MRIQTRKKMIAAAVAGLSLAVWITGCGSDSSAPPTSSSSATTRPLMANIFGPIPKKGGAQLWAETCARCHNAPPPDRFSDAQWETIVHHMRLRADLTGEEARQITEFLKASN